MSIVQPGNLLKLRFVDVADAMLGELRRFLGDADGDRTNFVIVLNEDDARVGFDCLRQLGLEEDAVQLARSFMWLEHWTHARVLDSFGEIAGDSLERLQQYRSLFGPVPSPADLENSKDERALRDRTAIDKARRLLARLEKTQSLVRSSVSQSDAAATKTSPSASRQQLAAPPVKKEQLSLKARIIAFLGDAAERTGQIPTFEDVERVFGDEIEPRSTFYKNNPWFKTVKKALRDTMTNDPPPVAIRNASDGRNSASIDAQVDAPDFFQDED